MCKQVEHGDMSSNHKKNKYKNKIRYQDTESVVCK